MQRRILSWPTDLLGGSLLPEVWTWAMDHKLMFDYSKIINSLLCYATYARMIHISSERDLSNDHPIQLFRDLLSFRLHLTISLR